jgi:hypothetical protein
MDQRQSVVAIRLEMIQSRHRLARSAAYSLTSPSTETASAYIDCRTYSKAAFNPLPTNTVSEILGKDIPRCVVALLDLGSLAACPPPA